MITATEYRHEYKYLCSPIQLKVLEKRLEKLLRVDKHAGESGTYLIRSVYFDTPDNTCYYENENGVDPRSKFRIRIYNCSDTRIVLERKMKRRTMTHKDACEITREQCDLLLSGKNPAITSEMPKMLAGMLTEMQQRAMRPAVIVQYERKPFICPVGNVRVTIDMRISSSQSFDRFFERDMPSRQILANGQGVLEVKWDQLLPSYIKEQLQIDTLQWTAFSKYYLCRKYNNYGVIMK